MVLGSLLNADDDWQESLRKRLYPALNPYLHKLGKRIGVPLFSMGRVGASQLLGATELDEDAIEDELCVLGFERNPIACYKHLPSGEPSEGSWVLTHPNDTHGLVAYGRQLHLTMFDRENGKPGRRLYAHYEDDWRVNPLAHLREKHFSSRMGVIVGRKLLGNDSFIDLQY